LTGPSRARAQFGNRLRRLREDAGLNGKELAAQLGWAPSKVSRIETGQRTASLEDVTAWTLAVGAPPETGAELLEAHRVMRVEYDRWALMLRRGHGPKQRARLRLDAATSLFRVFEPNAIPGLLQTAEYARYILSGMTRLRETVDDVEEAVRLRLQRQELLYDPDKQFRLLLTEASLRNAYAPPAVMRGQLDRLLTLASLDNIQLGIIPFGVVLPVVLHNPFWLRDDSLVLAETYSAELSLRDPEDIALYERVFEMLWEGAEIGEIEGVVREALTLAQES
jgi:transcriptional regulator with XRE-family HTH domain